MSRDQLIIGCGYLGARVASLLVRQGLNVNATTLSEKSWPELQRLEVNPTLFDIAALGPDDRYPNVAAYDDLDVFFMLTPSAIRPVLDTPTGYDSLLRWLGGLPIRRAILVSSTSVYGSTSGTVVSAETIAKPADTRGQIVAEIERRWLNVGQAFMVCRLAGLYGPGRIIGRNKLASRQPISGDPDSWLNLIHIDDAADFVIACARSQRVKPIELVSDGRPVKRRDYYGFVAEQLGISEPVVFDSMAKEPSATSRRCDPSSTMNRVGWQPRYSSYREGLLQSFKALSDSSVS
ncbi:MAG: nucleoside-diphosphate-sugar epimerase [Gammaproteobacteria bacterium]|jgi:nucleoside-diphosphate-sugar epimerase